MKKTRISLLVALLLAALSVTGAVAAVNAVELEIEPPDIESPDTNIAVNSGDGVMLEDGEGLLLDPALPEVGNIDLSLDSLQDDMTANPAPASAAAANDSSPEDFEIINGILVKYNGAGGDVVIPDGVTAIGGSAFSSCSSLTSITIPDSVTSIGDDAFYYCSGLTGVTIPNSVTSIGEYAFYRCSGLTSVTIPNSVTSIGGGAFEYCTGLTSIAIPNSVKSIGNCAFGGCSGLTSVTIPASVTSIGDSAFSGCSGLTGVTIPNSVKSIGSSAFYGCSGLTGVTIPNSVTSIGCWAFSNCSGLTGVTIPNSVTIIYQFTFSDCSSLTSITIPDSVTSIGWDAFEGCSGLTNVTIGSGVTYIDDSAFKGCTHLEAIILPARITSIRKDAFCQCYSLMDVTIENGKISINDTAFSECPATMTFHTPCESPATKWAESKGYAVVKSDHTPVTDPAVAPTLNKTGLTEGSHCSACDTVFVKQEVIPKLISVKSCAITGISDAVYTGKAIVPAPVVEYNGEKLVEGTDYTVKYANNRAVGRATVTITGIGKYGASVSKTFKINPKAVALSKLTPDVKQLTVTWKKGKGITGYEVQYSLKKTFAQAKRVTIKKAGTVKTVLKKLQSNKTYYVRVRTYKTVGGKKYYSAWSKAMSAKVK